MLSSSNSPRSRGPSSRRVRLVTSLSALGALGALLLANAADAQVLVTDGTPHENPILGGGIFVGYTFGEHASFEGGVEGFADWRLDSVGNGPGDRTIAGSLLQLAWRRGASRITLAAQTGVAGSGGTLGLSGELGGTYRFGESPGFGIHTGVATQLALAYGAVRHQFLLGDTWVGGGLQLPSMYGPLGSYEEEGWGTAAAK